MTVRHNVTHRHIIQIDGEKCDGCGLCVPACEEGAIKIIEGKACVVSDTYCDGLGACLGHCPRGAISIIQREAAPFDRQAVAEHLAATGVAKPNLSAPDIGVCAGFGGPGAAPRRPPSIATADVPPLAVNAAAEESCRLVNWPVQLHLVSPQSPLLHGADLLLVADCVPVACAGFHARILDGRPVVIGCPKLDDCHAYVGKLAAILQHAQVRSVSVVRMEVPCCTGLLRVAEAARRLSGINIPLHETIVTAHGDILAERYPRQIPASADSTVSTVGQLPIL